ncbi:MAG: phospho-N-acetylmuramoyl-pentapeptide-transferase [Planctomycetes bacterium]|nr:phospho-N-acetylmuramoyl-pentapeptide-transferase [Planctomycetota bacterium]
MIYELLVPLSKYVASFRAFESVTLRAACAAITAFLICLVVGPGIIERLASLRWRDRSDFDSERLGDIMKGEKKEGTPTMGGMIFLLATVCSGLLFCRLDHRMVVLCLWTTVAFGVLGGIDDRIKLLGLPDPKHPNDPKRKRRGMDAKPKLIGQVAIALVSLGWAWSEMHAVAGWSAIRLPFVGAIEGGLLLFVAFGLLVVVGTNNAVNLTDGLDGLAAGCGTIVTVVLGLVAYCVGRRTLSVELHQLFVPGADEVAVFLAALGGGVVGFLWWNFKPAKVFMGNTGSLALGGALGISAVLMRQEVLLLVAGFAFVWEALSVILQVSSFKLRGGKRVFLCSPYHHHLQFKGWTESRVVMSFWIGTAFLSVLALGLQRVI